MFHRRWKSSLDRLLGRVVVGNPDVLGRDAGFLLDVIEVGLRLDDRLVALGLEARRDEQTTGAEPAGGCGRGATCWPQTLPAGNVGGCRLLLGRHGRRASAPRPPRRADAKKRAFLF